MKKLFVLTSLSILLSPFSYSQITGDRGYVGLSVGPNIPTGDFASKDINKPTAGWAKTGYVADVSLAYNVAKNFAVIGMLRTQGNSVDFEPLLTELSIQNPSITWAIPPSSWNLYSLMGGGQMELPINMSASFLLKVMAGIANISSPEIKIVGSQGYNSASVTIESSSANASILLLGGGFKIALNENIGLLLNLDYSKTTPQFTNVKTTSAFAPTTTQTFSQPYSTYNLSVGIAFTIKSRLPALLPRGKYL